MIKKIDENGIKIQNFKRWKKNNPNKIYFDSKFEYEVNKLLTDNNVKFERNFTSFLLQENFKEKAINSAGKLYISSIQAMTYKPDFIVHCDNGTVIYLEAKGFFRSDARMRVKLFQYQLNKKYNGKKLCMVVKYGPSEKEKLKYAKSLIRILKKDFSNVTKTKKTISI